MMCVIPAPSSCCTSAALLTAAPVASRAVTKLKSATPVPPPVPSYGPVLRRRKPSIRHHQYRSHQRFSHCHHFGHSYQRSGR